MSRGLIIQPGDLVTVRIPECDYKDESITRKLAIDYNDRMMIVKAKRGMNRKAGFAMTYELDGAEGKNGMPYTFMRSWLVKENV